MRRMIIGVFVGIFFLGNFSVRADVQAGIAALEDGDVARAANAFNQAYQTGDGDGAFYLGRMAEMGLGIDVNLTRATALYVSAAASDSILAFNRLGMMHLSGDGILQDFEKGAQYVCRAAEDGIVEAQFTCGSLYMQGKGVPKDLSQAMQWFKRASDKDHIASTNFLALGYMNGQGVSVEPQTAQALFAKSAEKGNALGLHYSGLFAGAPDGPNPDLVLAHMYFNLAAARGYVEAVDLRAEVEGVLTPEQVAEAQTRAREWVAR